MSSTSASAISMTFTLAQQKALAICPKISAVLSFLGSSLVAIQIIQKRKRKSDGTSGSGKKSTKSLNIVYRRLVLGMSCSDICSSIAFFCSTWLIPPPSSSSTNENEIYGAMGSTATCTAQGFLAYMTLVSVCYNACLAFYYFLVIGKGWNDKKMSKHSRTEFLGHAVVFLYGICTGIVGASFQMFNSVGWTCWIAPYPSGCVESWRRSSVSLSSGSSSEIRCDRGDNATLFLWIAFYIPIWLAIVFITIMMSSVYQSVQATEKRGMKYSMHAAASRASNGSRVSKFSNIFARNSEPRSESRPNVSRQSSINSFSLTNNGSSRRNIMLDYYPNNNGSRRNISGRISSAGSFAQQEKGQQSSDPEPQQQEEPQPMRASLVSELSASRGMSIISSSTAGGRNSFRARSSLYGKSSPGPSRRSTLTPTQRPGASSPHFAPGLDRSVTFDMEISESHHSREGSIVHDPNLEQYSNGSRAASDVRKHFTAAPQHKDNYGDERNANSSIASNQIHDPAKERDRDTLSKTPSPQQIHGTINVSQDISRTKNASDEPSTMFEKSAKYQCKSEKRGSRDNSASSNNDSRNSLNNSLDSSLVFAANPQAPAASPRMSVSSSMDQNASEIQGRRSDSADPRMLSTIISESLMHVSQKSVGSKASRKSTRSKSGRRNSGMNRSTKREVSKRPRPVKSKSVKTELNRSGSFRRFIMHIPAEVLQQGQTETRDSAVSDNRGSSILRRLQFFRGSVSVAGGSVKDGDTRAGVISLTSHNSRDALKKSRKVANQAILYVGSLIVTWCVPTVQSLYYTFTGRRNFGLLLLESFLVPTAGVWNLLMYLRPTYLRCRKRYTTVSTLKLWQMLLIGKSEQDVKMLHKHMVKQQRKQAHKNLLARQRELQSELQKQRENELEAISFPTLSASEARLPSIFEDKGGGRRAHGGIKAEMERQAAMELAKGNNETPADVNDEDAARSRFLHSRQKRTSLLLRQVSGKTKTSFDPSSNENRSSEFGSSDNSRSSRKRKNQREKLINNWQANYNNYPGRHRIGERSSGASFTPLDREEELVLWQPITSNPDQLVRTGSAIPAFGRHVRGDVEDHRHNARVRMHRRMKSSATSLSLSGAGGSSTSNQDVNVSNSANSSSVGGGRISQRNSTQSLPEYLKFCEKTHRRARSRHASDANGDGEETNNSDEDDDVSEKQLSTPRKDNKPLHSPITRIPVTVSMLPTTSKVSPFKQIGGIGYSEVEIGNDNDDKRVSVTSTITPCSNHARRVVALEEGIQLPGLNSELTFDHKRRTSSITMDDHAVADAVASFSLSYRARGSIESLPSMAAQGRSTSVQETKNHNEGKINSKSVVTCSLERRLRSSRTRPRSLCARSFDGDERSVDSKVRSSSIHSLDMGTIEKVKRTSSIIVPGGGLVNDLPGVDLLSFYLEGLDDDDDDDDNNENGTSSVCSVGRSKEYSGKELVNTKESTVPSVDDRTTDFDMHDSALHVSSHLIDHKESEDLADNKHDSDYFHSSINTTESFTEGNDDHDIDAPPMGNFLHFGTTLSSLGSNPEYTGMSSPVPRHHGTVPVSGQRHASLVSCGRSPTLPFARVLAAEEDSNERFSGRTLIERDNSALEEGRGQIENIEEAVLIDDVVASTKKRDRTVFINEDSILSDDIETQTQGVRRDDNGHYGGGGS